MPAQAKLLGLAAGKQWRWEHCGVSHSNCIPILLITWIWGGTISIPMPASSLHGELHPWLAKSCGVLRELQFECVCSLPYPGTLGRRRISRDGGTSCLEGSIARVSPGSGLCWQMENAEIGSKVLGKRNFPWWQPAVRDRAVPPGTGAAQLPAGIFQAQTAQEVPCPTLVALPPCSATTWAQQCYICYGKTTLAPPTPHPEHQRELWP